VPASKDWLTLQAKTIQIFLPDGNARSIRIAEITSRNVRAMQVPRSKLKEAEARPELGCVGLYFLFGESEGDGKPVVYIGEAEDCCIRLKQHTSGKDFWDTAIVVSSKTNAFTKTHVKYLEWHCHDVAKRADRFTIANGSTPAKSYVPEPLEADLLDGFDTIRDLLSTLGFPVFEELHITPATNLVLYCNRPGTDARGSYIEDGFVVLKGSVAKLEESPAADAWVKNLRKRLRSEGVLQENQDKLVFSRDHLFKSPSTAAIAVLGRRGNGWTEWHDSDGRSLDELER
jgi:uncharacterized protein DUF4357